MTIWQFENREEADLVIKVEPSNHVFTVPHLATLGIRSTNDAPLSHVSVSQNRLSLWLDDQFETDLVEATPYTLLKSALCVDLGWCGGLRAGQPCHVDDLLPQSGMVSSQQYAELMIQAEGEMQSAVEHKSQLLKIAQYFENYMGKSSIAAEELRRENRRPFEDA